MLHHHDGVAQVAQRLEHADEALGVAAVEADGGLVEDVERTHQGAAQRRGQVDALALAAGEAVGEAREGEVGQAHLDEELQARGDLREQTLADLALGGGEFQLTEPVEQGADGHVDQLGDGASADLHVGGLATQACAATDGAHRLAAIAGQHDAVLYLILSLTQVLEEGIDGHQPPFLLLGREGPGDLLGGFAVPEPVLLGLSELIVRLVDGEAAIGVEADEPVLPLAQLLAAPAHHGAVADAARSVGHHKAFVDADDAAVALTLGAGAQRGVEGEELVGGFLKSDAVGLEARGEGVGDARRHDAHHHLAAALVERRLYRVGEARDGVLGARHREAVHHQQDVVALKLEALKALSLERLHIGLGAAHHHEARALAVLREAADDVLHALLLHLFSGDGAEGAADAGVEQAQVFVDLGGGAHRAARIA